MATSPEAIAEVLVRALRLGKYDQAVLHAMAKQYGSKAKRVLIEDCIARATLPEEEP